MKMNEISLLHETLCLINAPAIKTTTTLCVPAVGTWQDSVQKHVIWVC